LCKLDCKNDPRPMGGIKVMQSFKNLKKCLEKNKRHGGLFSIKVWKINEFIKLVWSCLTTMTQLKVIKKKKKNVKTLNFVNLK
jgi:hypothetical protein